MTDVHHPEPFDPTLFAFDPARRDPDGGHGSPRAHRVRAGGHPLGGSSAFPAPPLHESLGDVQLVNESPTDSDEVWTVSAIAVDDEPSGRSIEDDAHVTALVAELATPARRVAPPGETDVGTSFGKDPSGEPRAGLPTAVCVEGTGPDQLSAFFDLRNPLLGADYQRTYPLPDGRVLWLFQDAFVATAHGRELVHNIGLLQSGSCFQLLRAGTAEDPTPYLLPELTDPYDLWFWPLGGDVGDDGLLHVFVAQMRELGDGYLVRTEPVATWLVSIDPTDLHVVDARPAPDASSALYGWSVVSDDEFTYLYAHCYRQFGWDPLWFAPDVLAHDWDCSADVTVGRIPKGDFTAAPVYWDGSGWVADQTAAVAVIPCDGRSVNPTQVARWRGRFVAVTKVDDWWGDRIALDEAPEATGPWTTYATVQVTPECDGCNTYFASIVPFGDDESSFVVGLSGNVWTGECTEHYTPTFLRVPAPT